MNADKADHNRLAEIRERYQALEKMIGPQGGGDRTLHDISYLLGLIEDQQAVLRAVDRLFSQVMTIENLHIFEPVAARVTAHISLRGEAS